ncbi:MAG: rhodanese-like domain-containing protein, partial [Gammaproteobacteria bacterium]|nr:rhodanese-like domain-containing protein [Gammaproteobacteria bacterium]
EPNELEQLLDKPNVVIVDLCKAKQYAQTHIPGAYFVNYADIVCIEKPVMGLLPDAETFSTLISNLGIDKDTHVIAYDDEGGGCASRFIWTLNVFGHEKTSLLNGGLHSWANEGHRLSNEMPPHATPSGYALHNTGKYTADRNYIQQHLNDANTVLLDARSPAEYSGEKKFAEKGGHIPGAILFEWTDAMDRNHNLRMLPEGIIEQRLEQLGITRDKEVICYCQSHHRSAYSCMMLMHLGYENVKGYPGSWSDWGNQPNTPVE